ncbi:PREDICTED: vegetative cell wall protein gp1-like [Amphimedon queenslandica]|uniref:Uncharacterized protein n=1 Tax=Amphimedon queenslandica TaxID=400682 RepID=A0A1X7VVK5_AMPQE|nr:PREDICTED: vegetative cell wall protein gp1-like [Amphimedon queenslandica]|eukprot:XP_019849427.1 PREDICTED: vegetative cell wall protein gp1-like [Amphimedon queenslandica]
MKLICCALLLIALGAQAYLPNKHAGHLVHPYNYGYQQGYHGYYPYNIPINYRYNGGLNHHNNHHGHRRCPGNTQTCPEGYTFNRRLCGCFKDGDELPETTGQTPRKVKVPVPVPVPIPAVRPPPCQRIFPCTVGQVFDESRCQCVCAVQITQCPGRTTYNPSQCKCECTIIQACLSFQRFNTLLCVCEPSTPPTVPLPPAPLPPVVVFPPAPAPPGPLPPLPPAGPICPPSSQFRCNSFQVLNPSTCNCECSPLAASRCRFPQSLNPTTCQCECSRTTAASCNSQLQRFNFDNCECECINVFVTIQRTIPGAPVRGPSIPGPFVPGPFIPAPPAPFPPFIPRTGRTGTPGTRSKRRAKKREARNGEVLGPDGEFKVRGVMKRRTGPTGPGTGPGFIFPPILPPVRGPPVRGPSIPGPFVPGPSTIVTERRLVSAPCPAGTVVNSRSCECL